MSEQNSFEWTVGLSGKIKKKRDKLPSDISKLFLALVANSG
jgi:hypothetical protein